MTVKTKKAKAKKTESRKALLTLVRENASKASENVPEAVIKRLEDLDVTISGFLASILPDEIASRCKLGITATRKRKDEKRLRRSGKYTKLEAIEASMKYSPNISITIAIEEISKAKSEIDGKVAYFLEDMVWVNSLLNDVEYV